MEAIKKEFESYGFDVKMEKDIFFNQLKSFEKDKIKQNFLKEDIIVGGNIIEFWIKDAFASLAASAKVEIELVVINPKNGNILWKGKGTGTEGTGVVLPGYEKINYDVLILSAFKKAIDEIFLNNEFRIALMSLEKDSLSNDSIKETKNLKKVFVIPFQNVTELAKKQNYGTVVSEMLTTSLKKMRIYQVIEREKVKRILTEQKFNLSLISTKDMIKIGELLKADMVLTGSVSVLGDIMEIDARLIDIDSSEILKSENIQCDNPDNLRNSINELTIKLFQ